jgi:hypothetical protein
MLVSGWRAGTQVGLLLSTSPMSDRNDQPTLTGSADELRCAQHSVSGLTA